MKKTLVALAALAATGAFAQTSVQITGAVDAGYKTISHDKNATAEWKGIGGNNVATSNITFKGVDDIGGGLKGIFLYEIDPTVERNTTLNQSATNLGQTYTGASAVNSEAYVGLQSASVGELKLGTPNSPAMTGFNANAHPFGTAMGGGWSSGFGRLGTAPISGMNQYLGGPSSAGRIVRSEKAAVYTSPVFNGFNAQIEYSAKNANGGYTSNDNGLLGLAANYDQGPLKGSFYTGKVSAGATSAAGTASGYYANPLTCYQTGGTTAINGTSGAVDCKANYSNAVQGGALAANESVKFNMLSGNYTVGNTTVYAGYTTTKGTQAAAAAVATSSTTTPAYVPEDSKSWNIAAKQVVGQFDFLGNYVVRKSNVAKADVFKAATTSLPSDADYNNTQKLLGLGVNYNFSKLTQAYFRYERITGLNAAAASAAASTGTPAVSAFGGATQTTTAVGLKTVF